MLAAALTLSHFVKGASIQPAEFQCELVLVSTFRGIRDLDDEMAWARRQYDPSYPQKASIHNSIISVSKAAVRDAVESKSPFVVIDSAGLRGDGSELDPPRYLEILQSGNENAPEGEAYDAASIYGTVHYTDRGGAGFTGPINFGRSTQATGIQPPEPHKSWPTFTVVGIHDFENPSIKAGPKPSPLREWFSQQTNIALVFSTLSTSETAELPITSQLRNNQICLCAWGAAVPNRPNLIAFPPEGRAMRYKFGYKDGKWFANLIKAY